MSDNEAFTYELIAPALIEVRTNHTGTDRNFSCGLVHSEVEGVDRLSVREVSGRRDVIAVGGVLRAGKHLSGADCRSGD